jgi:hypothetical protein
MKSARPIFLLISIATGCAAAALGDRVLLLPTPGDNSHVFTLRAMYDEIKARGHEPYVRSFSHPSILQKAEGCTTVPVSESWGNDCEFANHSSIMVMKIHFIAFWHNSRVNQDTNSRRSLLQHKGICCFTDVPCIFFVSKFPGG